MEWKPNWQLSCLWLNTYSISRLRFQTLNSTEPLELFVCSFVLFLKILSPRILCFYWLFLFLNSSLKCRLLCWELSIKYLGWSRSIASNASIYQLFTQLDYQAYCEHIHLMARLCVEEEGVMSLLTTLPCLDEVKTILSLYAWYFHFIFLPTGKLFAKLAHMFSHSLHSIHGS